jgi:hypothetical protein
LSYNNSPTLTFVPKQRRNKIHRRYNGLPGETQPWLPPMQKEEDWG